MDRVPPQSMEMEQAALGAALIERSALETVMGIVQPRDFYRASHAEIFSAMCALSQRNEPCDLATLRDELCNREVLDECGGFPYLIHLTDATPGTANVETYARVVRDKAALRRLETAGRHIADLAHEFYDDVSEILEAAERAVLEVTTAAEQETGLRHVRGPMDEYWEDAAARMDGRADRGVTLGWCEMDRLIGGLHGGDLMIVAARPSLGKTALALGMALHVASNHGPVALFSLEMSARSIAARLAAMQARLDMTTLRRGSADEDEWTRFSAASETVGKRALYVDDAGAPTVTTMVSRARRLKAQVGLSLMVVDYIQLVKPVGAENRTQEISAISRALKLAAKDLGVPVVAVSQLSREVERRANKRPMMSDLRESGGMEQDADMVLLMYSEDYYRRQEQGESRGEMEMVEINAAKHRNGPVGVVRLVFHPRFARFDDLEEGRG